MRVSLLSNSRAGDGVASAEVGEILARHGYDVVQLVEKRSRARYVPDTSAELVVVAGGDGTVRKAAVAAAQAGTPLAIVPLGTANNIARSLGINGSISTLAGQWRGATSRTLDLGIARIGHDERWFVESVGVGLFPAAIDAMDSRPRGDVDDARSELALAVHYYRKTLAHLRGHRWALTLDGARMDDAWLLLEVLNMPSIGPHVVLSADTSPSDGFFTVVTATEGEREVLASYLTDRLNGRRSDVRLPTRAAQEIELRGTGDIHVDDEVVRVASTDVVSIRIQRGAVSCLVPAD